MEETRLNKFGDRLIELRKEKKLSQAKFGKDFGFSANTICNWEKYQTQPPIDTIIKLAKYFNISTDDLLGFNQTEVNNIKELKIILKDAGAIEPDGSFDFDMIKLGLGYVKMFKKAYKDDNEYWNNQPSPNSSKDEK